MWCVIVGLEQLFVINIWLIHTKKSKLYCEIIINLITIVNYAIIVIHLLKKSKPNDN